MRPPVDNHTPNGTKGTWYTHVLRMFKITAVHSEVPIFLFEFFRSPAPQAKPYGVHLKTEDLSGF